MAHTDVEVTFEIGHRSAIRQTRTTDGYTHDWEIFVRGVDGADISSFVEKVVFYLHETFPNSKRAIKEPPFTLKESGYAGFILFIDIYFKNKNDPKKTTYEYNLELQNSGPPINKVTRHKFKFPNPSVDLRKKLIKGGGIGVGSGTASNDKNDRLPPSQPTKSAPLSQSKAKPSTDGAKKHKIKELKPEEYRPNDSFSQIFGAPISKTTRVSPDLKKQSPSTSKIVSSSKTSKAVEKTSSSEKLSSSDNKSKYNMQKDVKREKDSGVKEEKKDKRDKVKEQDRKSSHTVSPIPKPVKEEAKKVEELISKELDTEVKSEKKKKDKKNKEEKSKKDKHKEHDRMQEKSNVKLKDKESKKSPKAIQSSRDVVKGEKSKDKEKHTDGEKDKQRHKHKKKEKEKNKKSKDESKEHEKVKKEKSESREKVKNDLPSGLFAVKSEDARSPTPPSCLLSNKPPLIEKTISSSNTGNKRNERPLSTLLNELCDEDSSDSNLSNISDEEDYSDFSHTKTEYVKPGAKKMEVKDPEPVAVKVKSKDKKLEASRQKERKEEGKKRKRKSSRDLEETDLPRKAAKPDMHLDQDLEPVNSPETIDQMSPDQYACELRELQAKIMSMVNLDNDAELQRLVSVVEATGQFEITKKTFDFDLCSLDRNTVKRLQDFFRNS